MNPFVAYLLGVLTAVVAFAIAWAVHLMNKQAEGDRLVQEAIDISREEVEKLTLESDYDGEVWSRRAPVPYCGQKNQNFEYPYRCTRPMGHPTGDLKDGKSHGYAGVFWE